MHVPNKAKRKKNKIKNIVLDPRLESISLTFFGSMIDLAIHV